MGKIIGGAIGIGAGISQWREGKDMQKKAQKYIDDFKWNEMSNSYEGTQVSTLSSDLQAEQGAQSFATSVDALRSGGVRGIIGGLGRVQANRNLMDRQIGADLDAQQKEIDKLYAGDQSALRAIDYQKQSQELTGYGNMLNAGMQNKYTGMNSLMSGGYFLGEGISSAVTGLATGGASTAMGAGFTGLQMPTAPSWVK